MKIVKTVFLLLLTVTIAIVVLQNLETTVAVVLVGQAPRLLPLGLVLLVCFGIGLVLGTILWLLQGLIRGRQARSRHRVEPDPPQLPPSGPTWPAGEPAPDRYSSSGEDYTWRDRVEEPLEDEEWR